MAEKTEPNQGDKFLVAYATHAGSTQEVAKAIATELRVRGLDCDLRLARDVRSVDEYRAVVLGAPLYVFHWLGDARKFLKRHSTALAGKPIAIFAPGPLNDDEKGIQGAREQLDKELAQFPWLKPLEIQVFVGKYDPARLHFPYNLMTGFPASPLWKIPPSDARNWPQIKAWAGKVADRLKS